MPVLIRTPGVGPNGPGAIDARRPISGGLGVGAWQPPVPSTLTTIRYVRKTGSDANGGTSPADAWLTINKALTTASPGTVIYVGAGVYRETVQVTITPTPSLPVAVIGDVDGLRTGDVGMVQLTAYTAGDKLAPSAATLLNLNGKSNLTFQGIVFVGGSGTMVTATTTTSQQIAFVNCALISGGLLAAAVLNATTTAGTPFNWLFDRCYFGPNINANVITFNVPTSPGPDYDVRVMIRNCSFVACGASGAINQRTIQVLPSGALAGKPGGVRVRNCTVIAAVSFFSTNAAGMSTAIPCEVYNCVICSTQFAVAATTAGTILEDYNLILSGGRFNVTAGAHSISDGSYAPLFHFGQELVWGGNLRPLGEPMASSPINVYGSDGAQTPYDVRGGPRPTGLLVPAVGAFERGNNFVKETGTVHTGTNAISVIGDGFADFDLPIDAGTRIITVYCQRDSNYNGPPPRLQVIPNGEIGVGDPSAAGTSSGVGAFEQLSVQVTPTGSGIVTVRVISSDVSGIAKTIFDTFAVS